MILDVVIRSGNSCPPEGYSEWFLIWAAWAAFVLGMFTGITIAFIRSMLLHSPAHNLESKERKDLTRK